MYYSKLSIVPLLAVAVLSSCSNDNELNSTNCEYVNSVHVTVEDFLPESSTRTTYTVDGSGFHFQWLDGDALGIYPVGGDQVKFPISNGDGSSTATFDGGAWKLRSEYQYAAYYPFSVDNYMIDQKALPACFTGQTQNGNGSTTHLGAYDYLACAATTPDANGGVDLTMKHLGAFLRLQLTMPKADTYSSVVLESDGAKFVTSGTFDLTTATPAITPTTTSSTYTINLTNVATTEKNQTVTIYAIVAPANLSSSNIKVTVHGTGQTTYVQTVQGKNFAARSAYNIAVETFPTGTNASGEDVNWEEPAFIPETVDLGLSVKWASFNVGASKAEEFGNHYAWGEIEKRKQNIWTWDTYKWGNSTENLIKYNHIDLKRKLEPEDDVASQEWGDGWRMPTDSEAKELFDYCTWTRFTLNGVPGVNIKGPNQNSIFIPFAGQGNGNSIQALGNTFFLWTSELSTFYTNVDWACDIYCVFNESNNTLSKGQGGGASRYQGRCVRPVHD